MTADIAEMTPAEYDAAYGLWRRTEGMGLSETDSRDGIAVFLERNPGLSFVARVLVARVRGEVVGTLLCGHDGRRGYLHHLAVTPACRNRGIGTRLVETCLARLAERGLRKCHVFVRADNEDGRRFWRRRGWQERSDLAMLSQETPRSGGLDDRIAATPND
jgi:ribosomal protein S18 acetylase RimI-like enzyme